MLRLSDRFQAQRCKRACLAALKTIRDMATIDTVLGVLPADLEDTDEQLLEACMRRLLKLFGYVYVVLTTPSLREQFCQLSLAAVELWRKSDKVVTNSEAAKELLLDHYQRWGHANMCVCTSARGMRDRGIAWQCVLEV